MVNKAEAKLHLHLGELFSKYVYPLVLSGLRTSLN